MKITDQDIPPELQADYDRLIANQSVTPGGIIIARTTKSARAPAPRRKPRKILRDYEAAVDFLIAYLTATWGYAPPASFREEQVSDIKTGNFNTDYWQQCNVESSQVLLNEPGYVAWEGPRNYAYPDESNRPSIPIYSAGSNSSGALIYTGATASGIYRDTSLKWMRTVFNLANTFTPDSAEPVFLKMTGTISASSDARPSRAMLSAVIKRWLCQSASATLTTNDPPLIEPIQALYRYITPRGEAPYFNLVHDLRLIYSMRSTKYEETGGELSKCVVLHAPMPMMGKRFNNNTDVTTELNVTLELWQIKKTSYAYWFEAGAGVTIGEDGLTLTVNQAGANLGGLATTNIGKSSGKWYWEYSITEIGRFMSGVQDNDTDRSGTSIGFYDTSWGMWHTEPVYKWHDASPESYGSASTDTDIIGVALDMDNGTLTYYLNGSSMGEMFDSLTGELYAAAGGLQNVDEEGQPTTIIVANFGASPFAYEPPSGYNPGLY